MAMSKQDVKKLTRAEFSKFLSTYGFRKKPVETFLRGVGEFQNRVSFGFLRKQEMNLISYGVAILNDSVQNLLDQVFKQSWHYGAGIFHLAGEEIFEWAVDSEDSLEKAFDEMQKYFLKFGLPFLNKYSSYPEIIFALTSRDRALWLGGDINDRNMMAIAYDAIYNSRASAIKRTDELLAHIRDPKIMAHLEKLKTLI